MPVRCSGGQSRYRPLVVDVIRDLQQHASDNSEQTTQEHAVAIGVFDGVHRGHVAVIEATKALANKAGAKMAVVTFDPHPATLVRPETAPKLLMCLDQKLELLEAHGVETVVVVQFDTDQASETAEDFVMRVLVNGLKTRSVVVGSDFHFGKGRGGNVELLQSLGQVYGFEVAGLDLIPRSKNRPESVSSTAIRRALAGGEVATAAKLLGRHHEIRGLVVLGDQRGRTLGFPTANIEVPSAIAVPADAVYAAWYFRPDGTRHPAAVNIGKRPTFYQDAEYSLPEAHLIGFEGDLYDEVARVQFVSLLRSEQRFDGIESLKDQLAIDIQRATEVLKALESSE